VTHAVAKEGAFDGGTELDFVGLEAATFEAFLAYCFEGRYCLIHLYFLLKIKIPVIISDNWASL
jgi:hypothetical protein